MRITTGMLHNSAFLNSNLQNGLGKTKSSKTGISNDYYSQLRNKVLQNSRIYSKTADAAESLRSATSALTSGRSDNLFEKARQTGSSEELFNEAKKLVEGYNSTVKNLNASQSPVNTVYRRMMESAASGNSSALQNIGITIGKDKTLSIDEDKFKSADIDTIEKALGSGSGFSSRVGLAADRAEKSALNSNMSSFDQYGSLGQSGFNRSFLSELLSSR